MRTRPARKNIPMAVKREVATRQGGICQCGCGTAIAWPEGDKCTVEFDHMPALRLREINRAGTDYIPAQNDSDYIVARCTESHLIKTSGSGATTAGTDIGAIKKERRRGRPPRPKTNWPKGQKIPSRPFPKGAPRIAQDNDVADHETAGGNSRP